MSSLSLISPPLQDEIKQAGRVFFDLFLVCTLMVIVGVVLEEIKWRVADSYVDTETGIFSPQKKRTFAKLGLWLLVLGIAGEGFFEIARNWTDGMLQDVSNTLLLNAEAQTGNAAKSARTAHDEANAVKAEAEIIQDRLNSASAQLSGMERQVLAQEPRWLILAKNADKFIRALQPFSGSRITVLMCGTGVSPIEQLMTEQRLLQLLGKPGTNWKAADWETGYDKWTGCPNTSSNGIEMALSADASDKLRQAAFAVKDELLRLGIPSGLHVLPTRERQFWGLLGTEAPEARAINDPTRIFLLVAPNAMIESAKPSTTRTKRSR